MGFIQQQLFLEEQVGEIKENRLNSDYISKAATVHVEKNKVVISSWNISDYLTRENDDFTSSVRKVTRDEVGVKIELLHGTNQSNDLFKIVGNSSDEAPLTVNYQGQEYKYTFIIE